MEFVTSENYTGTKRPHPIKRRCKELGITQKQLAKKLGVTPGTVSRYIHGNSILTSNDMRTIKLMKVLKIDMNYLKRY